MGEEVYDLSHFGWDNCIIPTNLKDISNHIPTYKSLKSLRKPSTFNKRETYFPHKFFKHGGETYMPAFEKGPLHTDGGYANIYKGRRAIFIPEGTEQKGSIHIKRKDEFQEICIKEVKLSIRPSENAASPRTRHQAYTEEIHAILYEAFLHALLSKTLEREGFPSAVPRMYDVVSYTNGVPANGDPTLVKAIWITMEFIQGYTLEKYLQKHLVNLSMRSTAGEQNQRIFLDIFVQLAFYLKILQEKVFFNHRDLKINNIFVRHHEADWKRVLHIPDYGDWSCSIDIVMIDFGFSCIACGEGDVNPCATLIGAGSWFRPEHDCLKYGRDLCQFLYSIHSSFPFGDYVGSEFLTLIRSALQATKGKATVDLMKGVDTHGVPNTVAPLKHVLFNEGIYIFLRDRDVEIPGCNPVAFLKSLRTLTV